MSLANHKIVEFIIALNDVVLYAETEEEILSRACKLAVEKGDFHFAWIGKLDYRSASIAPVVHFGYEAGYLSAIETIKLKQGPASQGPSARAFRERQLVFSNDIGQDPAMVLWRDEALLRGYQSSIGIPILIESEVVFVLSLYAAQTNRFDTPELSLLARLGENLGFAIGNRRMAIQNQIQQKKLLELSTAVQQTDVGVLMSDLDGTILFVNPGFCRMSGYAESEILGSNVNILASGQMVPDVYSSLWQKLAANESWRGVFENKKKDGSIYWESAIISPVFDQQGNKFRYIALKQDITEARQHEMLARTSMQLLHQRTVELEAANEELNKFTSAITHDLQEPLRSIVSFLQLFERSVEEPLPEHQANYLKYAIAGGHRLKTILEGMVRYTAEALRILHLETLNLDGWLQNLVEKWRKSIPTEESITIDLPKELPVLYVDHTALQNILNELMSNAYHYRRKETALKMKLTTKQEGNSWKITLYDNGQGIDPAYIGRLFRLFEHQHDEVETAGPGLGLPICQKLVERHGGQIGVVEQLQEGSGVWFTIPIREY